LDQPKVGVDVELSHHIPQIDGALPLDALDGSGQTVQSVILSLDIPLVSVAWCRHQPKDFLSHPIFKLEPMFLPFNH
jgi:hypothetical protein